jgi:hypothetical protein
METKVLIEISDTIHQANVSELQEAYEKNLSSLRKDFDENKAELQKVKTYNENLLLLNQSLNKSVSKCRKKIRQLENELTEYSNKIYTKKDFMLKLKQNMSPVLTSNQIDLITNKKKRVRWTKEELCTAFTIRYFGIKSYNYLRNQLNYPLPSLTTLRRYAAKLNLKEGILTDLLKMMKMTGIEKSDRERVTVLSFDEMNCQQLFELDSPGDEITGPHTHLQVIMARGLFSKWKTPIFVGFDTKVTKDLLNKVIAALDEISYDVAAITSDLGGGNQGLFSSLGVTHKRCHFPHPVTGNKITVFPDVPHLLKLTRNWLFETGKNNNICIFFTYLQDFTSYA